MPADVIMPALEMAQDFGRLLSWRKAEGEQVTKGEPLMEIETDKVTVEIEAPATGILASVTASPGDLVPVGQVIAWILRPGETMPEKPSESGASGNPLKQAPPAVAGAAGSEAIIPIQASPLAARIASENNIDLQQIQPSGQRIEKADVLAFLESQVSTGAEAASESARLIPASPKARRMAAEGGLDLEGVSGSGPGGAVLAADVSDALLERARDGAADRLPEPPTSSLVLSNVWRVMAERVTQSWTTVPHFYLIREVDASRLVEWRESAGGRFEGKLTYTDLLIYLVAAALIQHPRVNASWRDGTIELHSEVNLGLAVAVEEGLVVPVIHRAGSLSLSQVIESRLDLVQRARAGKLGLDDIRGGTFSISNLGMYGVDIFNAIVNPPQAAILAVGRIADRVVAVRGQPAVRPMMTLSLSFDHRVVDGARGAQFLDTLSGLIEAPMRLIE